MKDGRTIGNEVRDLVHSRDPKFWVPGVENGALGELLKFVEREGLWGDLQAIVKEEGLEIAALGTDWPQGRGGFRMR